mmetsp:Transcript_13635/g.13657  ORF Transcript_13635/g.13657 Transcript_13635/m.13657 type:complete len:124 (-) Transcript_13635:941-1312(-)
MVVLPAITSLIAERSNCSVLESSALVASSKIRIFGFLMRALAIAILCFCPPLSMLPLIPTCLSNPSVYLGSIINSSAWAFLAASSISSELAFIPYEIFSAIVPVKSTGSCPTRPICFLKCFIL